MRLTSGIRQPIWWMTVACLLVAEQFPFSDFPMYSRFSPSTWYVHLADATDRPLPTVATVAMNTSTLKKIYESELRKEARRLGRAQRALTLEEKRPVAERVLQRLGGKLRLYEVQITLRDGRLVKERSLLGETP